MFKQQDKLQVQKDLEFKLTNQETEDNRETNQSFLTEFTDDQYDNFEQEIIQRSELSVNFNSHSIHQNYKNHLKEIIKIQSYFRRQLKNKYLKKCAKKRRFIYQELIETERDYLSDLKLIINNVILVSQYLNLLPEDEINKGFKNINFIYKLNQQFYKELKEKFDKYNNVTCFGPIFIKFVPFFQIYFDYISDHQYNYVQNLREQYPEFDERLQLLETQMLFRGCDFNGFLVKPIQRLSKYTLLIKELIEFTWENHPDYESLITTRQMFMNVTNEINQKIGEILQNQMLFDLQTKFFNVLDMNILESSRKFLLHEQVNLQKKGKQDLVNLYLLSDMIIFSKRAKKDNSTISEKLISYHFINQNYLLINFKDQHSFLKFYLRLQLNQNQIIQFICLDQETRDQIENTLQQILANMQLKYKNTEIHQQNFGQPIRVYVSKITRGKSSIIFKTYAKYQLVIKGLSIYFNIWTRYKILLKIQNRIEQIFKQEKIDEESKEMKLFKAIKIDRSINRKPTQDRKIHVEKFLEYVLNSKFLRNNSQIFLDLLQLPEIFPKLIEQQNKQV